MRFKIDENLSNEVVLRLRAAGHDAISIPEQQMSGKSDDEVSTVCQSEQRALLTLDLDFSDIRRFAPADYAGIIILRPSVQTISHIARMIDRLLPLFDTESLPGSLWIVDDHQVRIRPG
ncbi:MAG: DUF5615 family PIN-like protein [Candidatus Saccharimonas sp.]|nr:DUF5615 family PIN-like protein [Planctomycetaceae bacterium]